MSYAPLTLAYANDMLRQAAAAAVARYTAANGRLSSRRRDLPFAVSQQARMPHEIHMNINQRGDPAP